MMRGGAARHRRRASLMHQRADLAKGKLAQNVLARRSDGLAVLQRKVRGKVVIAANAPASARMKETKSKRKAARL